MNDTLLARLAAERQLRLAKDILPDQFLPAVVLPNTVVGPRMLAAQLVLVEELPLVGDDQVARGVFNIHESIADTERLDVVARSTSVSTGCSGPLQQLDGVHMGQAAVDDAILFGIGDHHLRLRDCHALRVQDLVGLAVRETNDEGLERFTSMNSRIVSIVMATSF